MLREMGKSGLRAGKGQPKETSQVAILKDFGISLSQSSRWQVLAAVAVEQASFYEHGGDRTKESFKGKNLSLNEVADANGITRPMIVWAKAIWDAAETSMEGIAGKKIIKAKIGH